MTSKKSSLFFVPLLLILLSMGLSACQGKDAQAEAKPYSLAPLKEMPAQVQSAPVAVQQGYQFAVANPDILKEIPCYCGCGAMGHDSNYACYVAEAAADGEITFDSHSLGCSICVDITQDTMRLLDQGKDTAEIRAFIDDTYARYGPSNIP